MKSSLVILTLCTLSSAVMAQNIDRVKMTDNDMSCQQIYGEIGQMDGVIAKANQPQPVAAAPAADNSAGTQIAGAVVAQAAARSGFGGFGGFGGALGNLLGGAAQAAAQQQSQQDAAAQQAAAQAAQRGALLGQQAQGRKEHLTGLFLSKGCRMSDIQR
jgi:hypothetical protein